MQKTFDETLRAAVEASDDSYALYRALRFAVREKLTFACDSDVWKRLESLWHPGAYEELDSMMADVAAEPFHPWIAVYKATTKNIFPSMPLTFGDGVCDWFAVGFFGLEETELAYDTENEADMQGGREARKMYDNWRDYQAGRNRNNLPMLFTALFGGLDKMMIWASEPELRSKFTDLQLWDECGGARFPEIMNAFVSLLPSLKGK